ncbi:ankyrin repeat-containing domain protein [Ochromonadaceae sp. CCMP2298]|nr:ankyrin repeat-containing domain protein [Ochromonadaceae sp. CCMP2298]
MFVLRIAALCVALALSVGDYTDYKIEDVFTPVSCGEPAKIGDHILIEFAVVLENGTETSAQKSPMQLYHVLLGDSEELPVNALLAGMCVNETRRITWVDSADVNMQPVFSVEKLADLDQGISLTITVGTITTALEYAIFDLLRAKNTKSTSAALDLIEAHMGVNAVDEWGHTPLMVAVQGERMEVVAALLNTRMPTADLNKEKSSGFTALFYAVELEQPSLLTALLRRGAHPTPSIKQAGSRGTTPLHLACKLEKLKHIEELLTYGADPDALNEHGQIALQLIPNDAVRSTKLYVQRLFEEARVKNAEALRALDKVALEAPVHSGEL